MNEVRRYLFSLVAAALAVSLARTIPHSKGLHRIVDLLGGVLILVAVLRPLIGLRIGDAGGYLKRFAPDNSLIEPALEEAENESARLITEQTRAYILDKAQAAGAELNVQIELSALSDHYRYPYRAVLRGKWTAEQKRILSEYISQTLGIPEERQIWQKDR